MEEAEVLELYELQYSDLMLLSSTITPSSLSLAEEERESLKLICRDVMEALGPTGPGLLSISGVPDASTLRRDLLPLAHRLALLNPDDRKRILKEHNLGSDVPLKNPDRSVSSFAMQLRYAQGPESIQNKPSHRGDTLLNSEQDHLEDGMMREILDSEFKNLGNAFRKIGFCMMDLGLRIARICDRAIGGQELEQSLLESSAAKGRLIHYHSALDNIVLKEAGRSKATVKRQANVRRDENISISNKQGLSEGPNLDSNGKEVGSYGLHSNLWQQWHYDYGIFTVLTAPLFLSPSFPQATEPKDLFSVFGDEECPSLSDHTYLQIFSPYKNNVCMVKASPESFIIQPAWNKTFSIADYPMKRSMSCDQDLQVSNGETNLAAQDQNKLTQEIQKILPPLSSRLKDGMTFAEFSCETTKQYYGGSGLQSNR
ncbi:uncharacterized protein LOC132171139 isoform X2 [Corylus avellana]|uniref:uncharacterized protein LOC132171139 isoform X2 n=1 Tax=Corylus avellana TaxID=13451 RepID=UPI00286A3591|nr:uncharacterized protein LOC132171139 isoform X2 [Corylus avellana]